MHPILDLELQGSCEEQHRAILGVIHNHIGVQIASADPQTELDPVLVPLYASRNFFDFNCWLPKE